MVGPVEVAEDRAHVGAERFLRLDELALEKADQRFPLAGLSM